MTTSQRQSSCSICGVSVSLYFIRVSFRETLLKNRFPLSKEKLLNFNCGLSLMPVRIYFSKINFPQKNSSSGGYYRQMSKREEDFVSKNKLIFREIEIELNKVNIYILPSFRLCQMADFLKCANFCLDKGLIDRKIAINLQNAKSKSILNYIHIFNPKSFFNSSSMQSIRTLKKEEIKRNSIAIVQGQES